MTATAFAGLFHGMAERHYAHLAPSYVADIIRANLPQLGIVKPGKVARLKASRA